MKKTLRTLAASVLVCAAAFFTFVACSEDEETNVAVTGVTISPSSAQTLTVGGTLTITATVAPDNATNKAVTWKSSPEGIVTVADGVVTGVAAGEATITVTTVDGNKTASVGVTVNAAPDPVVPVTEVTISPSTVPPLEVGGTLTLTATVAPDNATNKAVTWSSSSTITTVSSAGVVTAVAAGAANITVTTVDGNKTASVGVTVNAPEPALDVTPTSTGVVPSAGGTYDITVTGNVEWTVTVAPANAWCSVSPASGNGNGAVTITVTPYTDPVGDNRSANVTFTDGAALTKTVAVTQERSSTPAATLCELCLWDGATWVDGYVTTNDYPFDEAGNFTGVSWNGLNEWGAWIYYEGAVSDRDGRANTAAIESAGESAIQICKNLGEGWYLPAYEELYNISAGNAAWAAGLASQPPSNGRSGKNLLTTAGEEFYWSSTEFKDHTGRYAITSLSDPEARAIYVNHAGDMVGDWKTGNCPIRCVWRP